jgi:hypothetical protein
MEPSEGLPRVGREVSVISFGLFCGASAINGMPPLEAVVREGGGPSRACRWQGVTTVAGPLAPWPDFPRSAVAMVRRARTLSQLGGTNHLPPVPIRGCVCFSPSSPRFLSWKVGEAEKIRNYMPLLPTGQPQIAGGHVVMVPSEPTIRLRLNLTAIVGPSELQRWPVHALRQEGRGGSEQMASRGGLLRNPAKPAGASGSVYEKPAHRMRAQVRWPVCCLMPSEGRGALPSLWGQRPIP